MRYLSVCSGIEAATVAWHPLGWRPVAFSEIDKFPSAVLAHHYPHVPNLGDLTRFHAWPDTAVDLLVGGTPCQSFSVAGLRAGLADPRGNLALTYLALADKYRPRWLVWENVPGVLSSAGGRDFGAFLGGLAELGYGFAYRVLDAQYFGLAQRRARVFVVGYLGDWRRAAAVLFERESLSGHPAPRREAGEDAPAKSLCGSDGGIDREDRHTLIPQKVTGLCIHGTHWSEPWCDQCGIWRVYPNKNEQLAAESAPRIAHSLRADGFDAGEDGTGRGTPLVPVAHAFDARQSDVIQYGDQGGPLDTDGHTIGVAFQSSRGMAVRRLTPRECCRLQGFPDDYLDIIYRGKPAADGPRYKALGNSMAVPVMAWIGRRLQLVDDVLKGAVQ